MRWQVIAALAFAIVIQILNMLDVPWPWLLGVLGIEVGIAISMIVDIQRGVPE